MLPGPGAAAAAAGRLDIGVLAAGPQSCMVVVGVGVACPEAWLGALEAERRVALLANQRWTRHRHRYQSHWALAH